MATTYFLAWPCPLVVLVIQDYLQGTRKDLVSRRMIQHKFLAALALFALVGLQKTVGLATESAMALSPTMKAALPEVYKSLLAPLAFTIGVKEGEAISFQDAAQTHAQLGSVAFVVRRPG
jgi:hypothetical protein